MKKTTGKVLAVATALTLLGGMQQALASDAYLKDGRGEIVRDPYGLCWRTGYWTPEKAVPECEGGIKKAVVPERKMKRFSFESDAFFDVNKFALKPAAKAKLDELVTELKDVKTKSVTIVGHTDSTGSDEYNQRLSVRRAESVREYLIERGVDPQKTFAKGMGESMPVASNATKEGRARNRRVTIEAVGEQE